MEKKQNKKGSEITMADQTATANSANTDQEKCYTQEEIRLLYSEAPVKKAQGKKILVVDDSVFMWTWISGVLGNRGYNVLPVEAGDGYEAIDAACNQKPNVIVMNVNMPNLNGLDAACEILEMFPEICVVFCSSESREQAVKQSIAVGGSDFIVIPCPFETLLEAIKRLY
jgi:CheY-like chemotaxis protein